MFLFKLSWRGPHCSDPSITYRLIWSKTVTQLSPTNSVLLTMQVYYLTQHVAFAPQWWSYTPSPFFQGKNKTAAQNNSRVEWLYWNFGESLRSTSVLHVLFSELFLFLITYIKYRGRPHNTLHQICSNWTPPWISVRISSINHPVQRHRKARALKHTIL